VKSKQKNNSNSFIWLINNIAENIENKKRKIINQKEKMIPTFCILFAHHKKIKENEFI